MFSNDAATGSGRLTASTSGIYARPCRLVGILLDPAAADCSVTVYDNASAGSGTIVGLAKATVALTGTETKYIPVGGPGGIQCNSGLSAVIAGAAAGYILYFIPA